MTREKILIIEDKESLAQMLARTLSKEGFDPITAANIKEGKGLINDKTGATLVLTDLRLPDGDGLEVLRAARNVTPPLPVIIMTAYGTIDTAVKAVKEGAFDFITKPFDIDQLVVLIRNALKEGRDDKVTEKTLASEADLTQMIGCSSVWVEVMDKAVRVADLKTTVLILGESGVGKELVARYIHDRSHRAKEPFVAINCSAIPKELVENEIFGHEKGAFTGAAEMKPGRFEVAQGGTIFLDEIGDMEEGLQAKLLRVIQESEFVRVGGTKAIHLDARIIAASNKDLKRCVDNGTFRKDLFYRLNVFPIYIPPLRERREDIGIMLDYYLKFFSNSLNKRDTVLSDEARALLVSYSWPGNTRELRNLLERALILSKGNVLGSELFDLNDPSGNQLNSDDASLQSISSSAQRAAERERIASILKQTGGNKTKAAEILKVSYKTLLTKIKDYGIV